MLSNCPVALTSKRYTWRHDSVLLHIQKALEILITDSNSKKETPTPHISQCFVKAGSKITKSSNKPNLVASALKGASDWKFLVDFDHDQVVFPPEILSTNERPDIVIWSIKLKKVILIELTCCAEEGISSAQLRKETRYLSLKSQIVERNWKTSLLTIEVGVRGFVGSSFVKCLAHLGFSRAVSTTLCKTVSLVAAKCSYTIYLASNSANWDSNRILLGPEHL